MVRDLPNGKPYSGLDHAGIVRMCLHASDIHQTYSDLKAKGIEFLSEPKPLPGPQVTIACFRDPDGTFTELLKGEF